MSRITTIGASTVIMCLAHASVASAAECWKLLSWAPDNSAVVEPTDCTTTPPGYGWVDEIELNDANDHQLLLPLNDPHLPWAVFVLTGYDSGGVPIIIWDVIPGDPTDNGLDTNPPEPGVPNAGSRVRLRHRFTGNCVYSVGTNNASARHRECSSDADLIYVLEDAGGGYYRLRNEAHNQCLFAAYGNGGDVRNWSCWNDPEMVFALDPASDGSYRIRDVDDNQCAYNHSGNSTVHHWACWADPNMEYFVDIVEYGGWTSWLDRDNPSGSGDWEVRTHFPNVCDDPVEIECQTTGGVAAHETGEVVVCDPSYGLRCKHTEQPDGRCDYDYRVRFRCE